MNIQRLNEHDRATIDRIVQPAAAVAEMVQAAMKEFLHSNPCRRYIERVVHDELGRAEEDKRCL